MMTVNDVNKLAEIFYRQIEAKEQELEEIRSKAITHDKLRKRMKQNCIDEIADLLILFNRITGHELPY